MNVLIVDDSALMRGVLRKAIQENGAEDRFRITEAKNGQEAMNAVERHDIDIVFLDWNMPVLNGLEFVKEVRGRGMETPIVMITAVTDKDRVYEACEAGVTDYIEKPIQGIELWERIKDRLV